MSKKGLWDQLVDCICRPPRDTYKVEELVGGCKGRFAVYGKLYSREDLQLRNKKGQRLECSHFKPVAVTGKDGLLPCVVYCHCNSGSRRDAEEALYVLLPHNITVFTLDFSGSGLSEGDWVSLGANEAEDLGVVVAHLRSSGHTSAIGLWGRSMGAVTALMYSNQDPSIAGVVVDSPFARLTELMMELVVEQKLPIPKPFMKVALGMMRRSVRKRAGFDIETVNPLDHVTNAFIPALFGHATRDTFIPIEHTQRLQEAYAGEKNYISFDGDHNSVRPEFFYHSALIFFHNVLQCQQLLELDPTTLSPSPHTYLRGKSTVLRTFSPPQDAWAKLSDPAFWTQEDAAKGLDMCDDVSIHTDSCSDRATSASSTAPPAGSNGAVPDQACSTSRETSAVDRSPVDVAAVAPEADAYLTLDAARRHGFMADWAAMEEEAQLQKVLMLSTMEAAASGSSSQGAAALQATAAPAAGFAESAANLREAEEAMLAEAIALSLQQSAVAVPENGAASTSATEQDLAPSAAQRVAGNYSIMPAAAAGLPVKGLADAKRRKNDPQPGQHVGQLHQELGPPATSSDSGGATASAVRATTSAADRPGGCEPFAMGGDSKTGALQDDHAPRRCTRVSRTEEATTAGQAGRPALQNAEGIRVAHESAVPDLELQAEDELSALRARVAALATGGK